MGARLRSWRKQIKQHLVTILVAAIILVVAITLIFVEIRVSGTGSTGKSGHFLILGDVIPARDGSRGRGRLALRQEAAKDLCGWVVLDVELDADRLEVALDNRLGIDAPGLASAESDKVVVNRIE
jgi:hypothetical protein